MVPILPMPEVPLIKEFSCKSDVCQGYGVPIEAWYRTTDPDPVCEICGGEMALMISSFSTPFSGSMSTRYADKKLEYAHKMDHEWILEKRAPGGPKWTKVDQWSDRRRILRQEGLVEHGGMVDVSSDGRKVSSQGMPGCWV
jgi:hypothetical protein